MEWLESLINFLKAFFGLSQPKPLPQPGLKLAQAKELQMVTISTYPVMGSKLNKKADVMILQSRLNVVMGSKLKVDGDFGPKTDAAVRALQIKYIPGSKGSGVVGKQTLAILSIQVQDYLKPQPAPAPVSDEVAHFEEALKYKGKKETDKSFAAFMVPKWKIVGLRLKTISTSSSAWCGLFIAVVLAGVGLSHQPNGAGAKNWAKYGVAIDWKQNGFPQGAIIHINSKYCGSGSGNHVTFSNGFCTAKDLSRSGATFDGLGGNQGNQVKVSTYAVSKICAVRWPKELAKPGPVLKSVNCTSGKSGNESTR